MQLQTVDCTCDVDDFEFVNVIGKLLDRTDGPGLGFQDLVEQLRIVG